MDKFYEDTSNKYLGNKKIDPEITKKFEDFSSKILEDLKKLI